MNESGNMEDSSAETVPTTAGMHNYGGVYFIRSGDAIKIGFSLQPLVRMAALQTSHSNRLQLLGVIPGSRSLEKELHRKFAEFRIQGEWFKAVPEILQYLAFHQPKTSRERQMARKQTPKLRPLNLTAPPEVKAMLSDLAIAWPTLPYDAKPIASNIIQICKKWDQCNEPTKLLAAQFAEFKRRMAA